MIHRSRPRQGDTGSASSLQYPVYVTENNAYRTPSNLYKAERGSKAVVAVTAKPKFVQLDDNLYVPNSYHVSAVPGEAGRDYPALATVPPTSFSCPAHPHPGLYADEEAGCQVFHICQSSGLHHSFLCPNGTVFNQQFFVCDWWYNFACERAQRFFELNKYIYQVNDDDARYSN